MLFFFLFFFIFSPTFFLPFSSEREREEEEEEGRGGAERKERGEGEGLQHLANGVYIDFDIEISSSFFFTNFREKNPIFFSAFLPMRARWIWFEEIGGRREEQEKNEKFSLSVFFSADLVIKMEGGGWLGFSLPFILIGETRPCCALAPGRPLCHPVGGGCWPSILLTPSSSSPPGCRSGRVSSSGSAVGGSRRGGKMHEPGCRHVPSSPRLGKWVFGGNVAFGGV